MQLTPDEIVAVQFRRVTEAALLARAAGEVLSKSVENGEALAAHSSENDRRGAIFLDRLRRAKLASDALSAAIDAWHSELTGRSVKP